MVIQRWQSVLLLISAVLTAFFGFSPAAVIDGKVLYFSESPLFLAASIIVALVLFVTIFLFKNLKQQMMVTKISVALVIILIATTYASAYTTGNSVQLSWGGALPLVAAISAAVACRLMKRDYKLLKSADRLR